MKGARHREREKGTLGIVPRTMMRSTVASATLLGALAALSWSVPAFGYRPFDGTDAAVAEPGQAEIELGPTEYFREGPERMLIAPALTINYGFAPGWEVVIEGRAQHGLSADAQRHSLVENALQLKHVLREGTLQEKSGLSLATEFGLLLPGIGDQPGIGGTLEAIASQQFRFARVHLSATAEVTRDQHADLLLSAIFEGPPDWPVRPVAELVHERDFGETQTFSGLVGAIWQVRDTLSIDFGVRAGRVNEQTICEVRAGLTFSFPLR
jgi:hypothetical protein